MVQDTLGTDETLTFSFGINQNGDIMGDWFRIDHCRYSDPRCLRLKKKEVELKKRAKSLTNRE